MTHPMTHCLDLVKGIQGRRWRAESSSSDGKAVAGAKEPIGRLLRAVSSESDLKEAAAAKAPGRQLWGRLYSAECCCAKELALPWPKPAANSARSDQGVERAAAAGNV